MDSVIFVLLDVMYSALDNNNRTGKVPLVTHPKKAVTRMSFLADPKEREREGQIQSSCESGDFMITPSKEMCGRHQIICL